MAGVPGAGRRGGLVFIPPEAIDLGAPEDPPAKEPGWDAVAAGPVPPPRLTRREREVITLIAGGGQSGDIAARLVLSPATIKSHVQNAMSKLGARTRAHAVAIALVTGQIVWSMYDASGAVAPDP